MNSTSAIKRKTFLLPWILILAGLSIFVMLSIATFEKDEAKQLNNGQVFKDIKNRNESNYHQVGSTKINEISRNQSIVSNSTATDKESNYQKIGVTPRNEVSVNQSIVTTSFRQACNPSFLDQNRRINRIFFAHMRKAGGTTIRKYLQRVAKKYELDFVVKEGTPADMPHPNSTTFYVTNLREPVSRLVSNYKYEGRWDCRQRGANHTDKNSITLEHFIDRFKINGTKDRDTVARRTRLWRCAQNCYVRWLSSNPRSIENMTQSYSVAYEKLSKYNLIIITEKLKDPTYVHDIESMFNVKGLRKQRMHCEDRMKELNTRYPPIIKNSTLDEIKIMNQMDSILYQTFASCPNNTVQFPRFNENAFEIHDKK